MCCGLLFAPSGSASTEPALPSQPIIGLMRLCREKAHRFQTALHSFLPWICGGHFRYCRRESLSRQRRRSHSQQPWSRAKMEPNVESIRNLVRRTLEELGLVDAQPTGETLLTVGGYYVGREFKFAGVRAVWMASPGQLKFYGDDGEVLRVVQVGEGQQAKAA
jgi:hypothetical protein